MTKKFENGLPSPEQKFSAKDKLLNLEAYLPGQEKMVYDFAKYLAARMNANESLDSQGFDSMVKSALQDLEAGNERVPDELKQYNLDNLVGHLDGISWLKDYVPDIKKAVLGKE
jgi:hypothetical protein